MDFWYQRNVKASLIALLLSPFALIFWLISTLRRFSFKWGWQKSYRANVPVVIVGNLSVGGNGKTPVTLWLAEQLQQRGYKVGIISRGYGSESAFYPRLVKGQDNPVEVGDEPLLMAQRLQIPVCIGAHRQQAIGLLQKHHQIDVILSDDGLQHYALQRDMEIVVMDAKRQLGNGFLLPAGPLRETPARLKEVDLIINNGAKTPFSSVVMQLKAQYAVNLVTQEKRPLEDFAQKEVNAFAGIGNPARFFNMLEKVGIKVIEKQAFADHQKFDVASLQHFSFQCPLFMTEKDAVKCRAWAKENMWFVPVDAQIPAEQVALFFQQLEQKILAYKEQKA